MTLEEIITPIGDLMTWTFDNLLVPIANNFNWACIVLGFVGLIIWMRVQSKYNAQAANDTHQIK